MPQLIVEVQTTAANVQDVDMTAVIQEDLAQHHLLPEEQIVDSGYVDAEWLVSSQRQHGLKLGGPVLSDNSWQAKAGKGFDVGSFHLDWQAQLATCPQGQSSSRWSLAGERIEVVFAEGGFVLLVRSGAMVRSPRPPVGCSTCVHKLRISPCRHGDKSKQPQSFGRRMRQEQASKGRFPKRYEVWGYDARAMMACTKPMCSMS